MKIIETLKGKKAYIIAAGMILYALLGWLNGQMPQDKAVELVLEALGLGSLRAGISKGAKTGLLSITLVAVMFGAGCSLIDSKPDLKDDPLSVFNKIVTADVDQALLMAQEDNDLEAMACYPVLKKYVSRGPAGVAQVKGAISLYQKARKIRHKVSSGVPQELKNACAPLLLDTEQFLLRLGVMAAIR